MQMGQGSSRLGESGTDPAQEAACSSIRDLRTGRVTQYSVLLAKLNYLPTYAGNLPSHSGQCTVVAAVALALVVALSQDLSRRLVSLRSPAEGSLCLT